jgi:dephospho-CoA kinase
MIKVGITGGIGSGKSAVCEAFNKLGVNIYNADIRAKALINQNIQIREKLVTRFGRSLYKNDQIDRSMLAGIIFEDKTALEFVNSIIHPAVGDDFRAWCKQYEHEPYVIEEAALLFESGAYKKMNKMVTIYAPEELRINRVMLRDKVTREQVKKRMNNQLPDEEKMKRSDFVIYNDEKHSVLEQVLKLHKFFLLSVK